MKGNRVLAKKIWKSKDTSKEILPVIDSILKKTGLTINIFNHFIVSTGPGSWTGIRLALSVAYGLSLADENKVFGVSCIDSIAYSFKDSTMVGVFLPSAGNSVHYGLFKNPAILAKKYGKLSVCSIEKLYNELKKARIVAGPDRKILSMFNSENYTIKKVNPDPVLNALLAYERIKNSVKPINHPYYEK